MVSNVIELIAKTTGNFILRLKPNKLYIIAEKKFEFQRLISILTACFDFLKNSEPLTQFKIYFMTQFSLTVPGVSTYPRCPQVTDALGLFLCPRFLFKFAVTLFYCVSLAAIGIKLHILCPRFSDVAGYYITL